MSPTAPRGPSTAPSPARSPPPAQWRCPPRSRRGGSASGACATPPAAPGRRTRGGQRHQRHRRSPSEPQRSAPHPPPRRSPTAPAGAHAHRRTAAHRSTCRRCRAPPTDRPIPPSSSPHARRVVLHRAILAVIRHLDCLDILSRTPILPGGPAAPPISAPAGGCKHPQRRTVDAEHRDIAQSHQQLAHARRVVLHRDPPVIRLFSQRRFWGIPHVQPRTPTTSTPTSFAKSRISLREIEQAIHHLSIALAAAKDPNHDRSIPMDTIVTVLIVVRMVAPDIYYGFMRGEVSDLEVVIELNRIAGRPDDWWKEEQANVSSRLRRIAIWEAIFISWGKYIRGTHDRSSPLLELRNSESSDQDNRYAQAVIENYNKVSSTQEWKFRRALALIEMVTFESPH